MYRLSQIVNGLRHPNLILREVNRYYYLRLYTRQFNAGGVDVFAEDWDNLVILDACRHDVFEAESTLAGTLEARESKASETVGFLKANFSGRDLRDTIYVTSNPQLYRFRDEIDVNLHDVINVWQDEGWNDALGTVRPETTTEYAIEASEQYPDKRIVVHYIQPHYPFLQTEVDFDKGHLEIDDPNDPNLWYKKMWGELLVSGDTLWQLYVDNLRQTLPHVETLLDSLQGKSVVTSDHGNMFGERSFPIPIREWGHPHSTFTEELVKVPWLVVSDGERRDVVAGDAQTHRDVDVDVEERLRNLGYGQ